MIPKLESSARHKILCMGRRWRKSTLGLCAAIHGHGPDFCMAGALSGSNIWWVMSSFPAAQSVWNAVKGTLRPVAKHISEMNRRVLLPGDGAITIKTAINYNSLVGDTRGIDGVVLDEAAQYDPLVWQQAIRPALSDRKGWSIWTTTPRGYNYFKDLYDAAPNIDGWERWREPSTANLSFDPAEIEAARREGMPENLIEQEFMAEFVLSGTGRTYSEFDKREHLRAWELDTSLTLDLCISFKVAPAAWLVTQGDPANGVPERAIDEVVPESGATTVRAYLEEFRKRYPDHALGSGVRIFGDASPSLLGKSTGPSDYELVRAGLPHAKHYVRIKSAPDKDRVNCVQNVLRDQAGMIRGYIDPACVKLVRDLEYCRNTDASFAQKREPGLGQFAHAWSAKLLWVSPMLAHRMDAPTEATTTNWPAPTPEARRAQGAVYRAIRAGKLHRPKTCQACGRERPIEAAHKDYSRPLDVMWLCKSCHTVEDMTNPKGGVVTSR